MNPDENNNAHRERQALLGQLNAADAILRANLHAQRIDSIARAHMERAFAHVREAYVAINEAGRARTVSQLVADLLKVEHLLDEAHQNPRPRVTAKSIRL